MKDRDLNIRFFYRRHGLNYSIERVFDTIYDQLKQENYIDRKYVKFYKANPIDIIRNLLFCYKNRGIGINHITGDIHYVSFTLPRRRTLLTVHDMVTVHNNKGLKRFFIWFLWFYLPCKWVRHITCISEATKEDLIKIAKCNPRKITVIPNPINKEFHFSEKTFNKVKPIILHIGTRENKNLERVIEALREIPCHLRIISNLSKEQEVLLFQHQIEYSNMKDLTDSQIIQEYIDCDIVSFPSIYEGFGMPVIEAQAIGRVVLTSNLQPMNSIANHAAIFVNPYDVNSIMSGFESIIADDDNRNKIIELGLKNVKKYTVENIVAQYQDVYQSLIKE